VINEMILSTVQKETPHEDDDDRGNGGNRGTMIVDATCAPSNIRYPQDASLLNEARENTEKLLDELYDAADGRKPRTYRTQAHHRDFLHFDAGQAQVRIGTDHDKAAPNHRPQRCHVHFGTESQKDSVRTTAAACVFGAMVGSAEKAAFVQLTLINH